MSQPFQRIAYYLSSIPHFFRYIFLAIFVLFISLFFPGNIEVDYKFEQGNSWEYEDLRAPFAFPIQKSKNELELEKKLLEKEFVPFYRLSSNIAEKQKNTFLNELSKLIVSKNFKKDSTAINNKIDSAKFASIGLRLLDFLYSKHIVKIEASHDRKNNSIPFILIENQTERGEYTANDFIDVKKATQIIVDSLDKVNAVLANSNQLLSILADLVQEPDIRYDADLTRKNKENAIKNLSPVRDKIKAGELIIKKGELVDSIAYSKLVSYVTKYEQEINKHKNGIFIYIGYLSLTIALIIIFCLYLLVYERPVYENLQHFSFLFILLCAFSYLAFSINSLSVISLYFIPFCIVPIIVKNFFSSQLAFYTHIILILIISLVLSLDFDFIFIQIIAGMVAAMSRIKIRYITDFFVSVVYIGLAYGLSYLCTELMGKGVLTPVIADDGRIIENGVDWENFGWIGLNIVLTMLSYPFIPLLEKAFGLISDITLIELSDLNKPLLRELSFKAPGTMQHSLQVSNLAEAAALEIDANALLVKVGALYHDIGKMTNPQYFIENQHQNNPHLLLTYQESAKTIISHVSEGVKLAKKYRLPKVIIDFISTHHGTTRVEYFYRMHKNEFPDKSIDEKDFSYPGPKPRNREEVILMLADSTEAASKSLKNPTGKDIDSLVENIISFKTSHCQLQESNITFAELDKIKMVFKKLLRSIYHVRIEYPVEKMQDLMGNNQIES
jgi:putative nucleotidyltransferase with HDIG domain